MARVDPVPNGVMICLDRDDLARLLLARGVGGVEITDDSRLCMVVRKK